MKKRWISDYLTIAKNFKKGNYYISNITKFFIQFFTTKMISYYSF